MILYYPIFTTKWEIETVNSDVLHFLWHSSNGYNVYNRKRKINNREYNYGNLMYSDRLFISKKHCLAYINRDYNLAFKGLYFKGVNKNV